MEGSRPVKTGPPQHVWMYAESSTGMENEELLLNDLPGLSPTTELSHSPRFSLGCPRPVPASGAQLQPGQRCQARGCGECWQGRVLGQPSLGRDLR